MATDFQSGVEAALRPQHDAPPCPDCGATVASPVALRQSALRFRYVAHREGIDDLWCPACGHEWTEIDNAAVARAWWSAGAYAGVQDEGRRKTPTPPPVADLRGGVERVRAFVAMSRAALASANERCQRTVDTAAFGEAAHERTAAQAAYRMALDCLAALEAAPPPEADPGAVSIIRCGDMCGAAICDLPLGHDTHRGNGTSWQPLRLDDYAAGDIGRYLAIYDAAHRDALTEPRDEHETAVEAVVAAVRAEATPPVDLPGTTPRPWKVDLLPDDEAEVYSGDVVIAPRVLSRADAHLIVAAVNGMKAPPVDLSALRARLTSDGALRAGVEANSALWKQLEDDGCPGPPLATEQAREVILAAIAHAYDATPAEPVTATCGCISPLHGVRGREERCELPRGHEGHHRNGGAGWAWEPADGKAPQEPAEPVRAPREVPQDSEEPARGDGVRTCRGCGARFMPWPHYCDGTSDEEGGRHG